MVDAPYGKQMKILFLGLGSIGQRHLQNAKKIFNNAKFFSYRKKNKDLIIRNSETKKKKFIKTLWYLYMQKLQRGFGLKT